MGDALAGGGGTFFDVTEDDVTGLASVKASPGSHSKAFYHALITMRELF